MAQSPEEMAATMIRNLAEKTGKSLEEWLVITKAGGLEKHGTITKYLKQDHGLTHGFANLSPRRPAMPEPWTWSRRS